MNNFALRIVRESFEEFVRTGEIPPLPPRIPADLSRAMHGVYVSAFENPGKTPRGSIGSPLPTQPFLAKEIQTQTVRLAQTFPFRKEDLSFLVYELAITQAPQLLPDIEDLPEGSGLLIRSESGKIGVSIPSRRTRKPRERLREALTSCGVDAKTASYRTYRFDIKTFTE